MSKIKVEYCGLIRNPKIVDKFEDEIYLSDGSTVGELLRSLVQRYGDGFRSMLLNPEGELLPIAIIHLNGRDINEIDGLNTKLADNSQLSIIATAYAISGG